MTVHELDEMLQHHGVKGMKWGVRRSAAQLRKSVKTHIKKRNAKEKKILDEYHEKRSQKSNSYKRAYNTQLKKQGSHYAAVRKLKKQRDEARNYVIKKAVIMASPLIIQGGQKAASKFYDFATDPATVRAGKNIVQAMKNSPIRYVDGDAMTNVVDYWG